LSVDDGWAVVGTLTTNITMTAAVIRNVPFM
jgi:hypothetical protein